MRLHRVEETEIAAAVAGQPMSNPRHALVQYAAQLLYDKQGSLSEGGLADAELIEVIAIIGWYVLSTFVNNLAHTEVDAIWTD